MTALSSSERKELATEAAEYAERYKDEPILPLDELLQMSREELDDYFKARDVVIDWEREEHDVRQQLGDSILLMNRGEELSEGRKAALDAAIEKSVVSGAREIANKAMSDMWHAAWEEADDRPEDEKYGMWLTVENSGPPCDDCRSFHGTVFAMDYWRGSMPTDGHTKCGKRCRCRVVPCGNPGRGREGLRVEAARENLN